jgi:hypothetical protein
LIGNFTRENEESFSIPNIICTQPILYLPEVKVYVSKNREDYFLYSYSSPIAFPIYTSGKSERPSSIYFFPPSFISSIPYDHLDELRSHHPEAVKKLVDQSFEVFDNILFSPRISSRRLSMVGAGGVGGRGVGGHGNIPVHPPSIFAKVVARYAPLDLLTILHDLRNNYMKRLPKFTGEGDLTTTEHISFFDQFVDILGIELEDVYLRLLVQNFERHVRNW